MPPCARKICSARADRFRSELCLQGNAIRSRFPVSQDARHLAGFRVYLNASCPQGACRNGGAPSSRKTTGSMTQIVNLRTVRKKKARAEKESAALENRIRFGLNKAGRQRAEAEKSLASQKLDGHRLDREGKE